MAIQPIIMIHGDDAMAIESYLITETKESFDKQIVTILIAKDLIWTDLDHID